MAMSDSYWNYYEDSHVQAVRLLYGILGRLSVVVFLPAKETSLSRFLQELTLSNLESWLTRMTRSQGDLVLPRFYTENQIDLVGALTRLGMGVAFQEGQAHFGAMTSLAAHIDRVTQQTWIQVDEEGTEAEAATIVSTVLGMAHAPKEKKFQMVVDRPFFYIIRDDISGMILFMGVTVEPNERP